MRRVDLSQPDFDFDDTDLDGYRAGTFRPGKQLGATDSGATVYELPPGESVCPYHYEYGEEEWLLPLDGPVAVRTPEGTETVAPSQLVFFPKGPEGAHKVTNDGDATVRVLMWSTVVVPTATAYPDSDKIGVWTGVEGENVMVERSSDVPYYHGES